MMMTAQSRADRLTVVAMGYLVRCPIGGMAWHHLQYVIGLARLGHEVYFLEDSGDDPWACYDPSKGVTNQDPSYGLNFARTVFERVGLPDRWAYHDALSERWLGPAADDMQHVLRRADVLLNLSGANPLRPWVLEVPVRVYIDTDPVFTQLRHVSDPARLKRALDHTHFFSFGENIQSGRSTVPDDGIAWLSTRQPIVLDVWPVMPVEAASRFTTVMQWEDTLQDVPREFDGRHYGLKSETFPEYVDLPSKTHLAFELALGGNNAPREQLADNGWSIRNPLEVTRDPWTYQSYIQGSKGEFSVAKHGYVVTQSGWFSERSACYLASGRPVVVQNTGFAEWLAVGTGVLGFSDVDSAIISLQLVEENLAKHCNAAREIAEAYFDSRSVLASVIEVSMASNRAP